ncbi:hypothetical protein LTR08_005065 [Meristemomyces frigidus]|nr:hypothetical protein LTR08_005065 [Meristemomyces frigidus]
MNALPHPPNFHPAASPTSTIMVPETPHNEQPQAPANHHRRRRSNPPRNNSVASSSAATSTNTTTMLELEIENLRAQRARLVEQVNDLTACVDRVRLRQQITELEARHERAAGQKAAVEAQNARAETATAEAAAKLQVATAERTTAWWKLGFWIGVVLIGGYGRWCWENTGEAVYIRQKNCERYGLSSRC